MMPSLACSRLGKILALPASLCLAQVAGAATAVEYFNDYGAASVTMTGGGINGGSGWSGGWTSASNNSYIAGTPNLYGGAGYSAAGNDNSGNDGAAAGSSTGVVAYRTFSAPMTGTIWISASVYQTSAATGRDILLWLDMTGADISGGNREFLALRGSTGTTGGITPEGVIAYNGGDDTSSAIDFSLGTAHLLLARVDMNVSGTFDSISFWVDPVLTGGIAGLGTALYTKSGADAYGTGFDGIGISGNGPESTIDAIRISNELDGFEFVTGIPEPSSAALLLAGAALVAGRRRRI